MNLLVTGGAGFIGSNFVRYCCTLPTIGVDRLINLDKLTYAGNLDNLADLTGRTNYHFIEGDIGDTALVSSLLEEFSINAIVNFAAESHVDRSIDSPEPFFQTNVIGTLRLVETTWHYWKKLPQKRARHFRFLHISTDEVYGSLGQNDTPFQESTPYAPNSPYAASKASSDHIVRAYRYTYGLPVMTTHCSNNYGPYQFPEKLIPLVILNALEAKPLPIYGDGQNVRDWLYVQDHCEALWQVLCQGQIGETYNIGGNSEKTNLEVVDTLCQILDTLRPRRDGSTYKSLKHFVSDRPGHDRRYAVDFDKIKESLGWKPNYDFHAGLRATVEWYLDNIEWCKTINRKNYRRERLGLSRHPDI